MAHCKYICLFLCLLAACTQSNSVNIETENERLNTVLKSAPISVINLDEVEPDTIFVQGEHILNARSDTSAIDPENLLGSASGLSLFGDTLFVADLQQNVIFKIAKEGGQLVRRAGRRGNGPGEFGLLAGLFSNSESVYAIDLGNSRIQEFDSAFNIRNVISTSLFGASAFGGANNVSIDDSYIYLPVNLDEAGEGGDLIEVRALESPTNVVDQFWPRLIPPGMQPAGYNDYRIDSNTSSDLIISYYGLPYFFLLNEEWEHIRTLYIESSTYASRENPAVGPVEMSAEPVSIREYISNFTITDEGLIYLSVDNVLYKIDTQDDFEIKGAWNFSYSDPAKRDDFPEGITITSMVVDDDILYVASIFDQYIYRFPLD